MATDKYICSICGWIYDLEYGDEEHQIAPNTPFEEVSDDWGVWVCPLCGAPKSVFEPFES